MTGQDIDIAEKMVLLLLLLGFALIVRSNC